ncbi:hypothetical protein GCM10025867_05500 [Frondihabitans sucicola]|uniref:N-acetyltransferase domain-containing protein n=1 Tax=Frondihabitans sucicola TaxID=1268041 RepID=A0ABN6XTS6_9MICO|nr:GNAT family N-acetyltransferase [Frondihabitans sucicola]BDZ48309.1 hypothetical protein GCM10025867_05500 [Frondihabitans sucicola]
MHFPRPLTDTVHLRPLDTGDAAALATAYRRNREHLAPWDPERSEAFFTEAGQGEEILRLLSSKRAGSASPLVLVSGSEIVGRLNLNGIVRGAFESASLGYWIDSRHTGAGVMSRAVAAAIELARDDLGLHRLEAGTLLHNEASQNVLLRNGFEEFGLARNYLRIAGRWQDHRLFQRILTAS